MFKNKLLSIALLTIIFCFFYCGAPKVEDGFLNQEYYQSIYHSKISSDSIFSFKIDSLTKELEKIEIDIRSLEKNKFVLDTNINQIQNQIEDFRKSRSGMDQRIAANDLSKNKNRPVDENYLISTDKINIFENDYKRALALFNSKNYKEAIPVFHKLLVKKEKVKDLIDNIYYWLAECYFGLKQYPNAIDYFNRVLEVQDSNKKEDALMMLGNSYEKIGNNELAKESYQKLLNNYPNSKYNDKAKGRISNLK